MTAFEAAVGPKSRRRLSGSELGLVIAGLVAAGLITVDVDGPARAVFAFAMLLLVPGWAVVRLLGFRDLYARMALTVIAGALLVYFVGLAMVWSDWWHPRVMAVVLLLAASLSLVLMPNRGRPIIADVSESGSADIARGSRRPARSPAAVIPWVWLAVAIGLWIVALRATQVGTIGDLGLLGGLPGHLVRRARDGLRSVPVRTDGIVGHRWSDGGGGRIARCHPQCLGESGRGRTPTPVGLQAHRGHPVRRGLRQRRSFDRHLSPVARVLLICGVPREAMGIRIRCPTRSGQRPRFRSSMPS